MQGFLRFQYPVEGFLVFCGFEDALSDQVSATATLSATLIIAAGDMAGSDTVTTVGGLILKGLLNRASVSRDSNVNNSQ